MTKDKATVAPCEHNHGTNFNWETKTVYDNGQMLCWDCNQIYTPEPLPQTYGSLVNERDQLLAEVARLREALGTLRHHLQKQPDVKGFIDDALSNRAAADWCGICNAPQMVLPDGQHICGTQAMLAANAAATEICDYCGIDTSDAENVAAIVRKHCGE
jgi:hypothetical protein